MSKLASVKSFVVRHKNVIAITTVAVATVAAVAIDVLMKDEEPLDLAANLEN